MIWYEFLFVFLFLGCLVSIPVLLWFLEKPERELRKKRLEAALQFYHSAGYVFDHIACGIDSYDATLNNIESALISIDNSLFAKEEK